MTRDDFRKVGIKWVSEKPDTELSWVEWLDVLYDRLFNEGFHTGDLCRYKGYTDRFMITHINPDGKTFDGVYPDGSVVNDGSIELIEKIGHYCKLDEFLFWIKGDKDEEEN